MDCGAACLAMICRYYGRAVPVSYIREVAHTTTRGTTLNGITRAAEELGLDARSIRASKSRLDELPLPAIVHWQGDHWVVLYRVERGHVRVADPESGLRRYEREEFLENWTGYASVIAYGEGLEQQPAQTLSLGWIRPFLRPYLTLLVIATFLAALAAGLELVLPILTARIVDNVIPSHDVDRLWILMGLIAAVVLAMTAASLIQRYLLSRVAVRFDTETLDHLTKTLLALPMRYFSTRRTGDIERRLSGAISVRQFLTTGGVQVITAVAQLIAAVILMFVFSWVLALVYLATIPALRRVLMRYSSTRLRPAYDDLEANYGRYSSGQIDAIRGIETVKALAAEDSLRRAMLGRFQTLARRTFRTQFIVLTYQGLLQLVNFTSFAIFLFVGALEVIHGTLTLGQFVAFNALIALANGPVLILLSLWDQLQQARVQLLRLDDVLEQEPEQGHDRGQLRDGDDARRPRRATERRVPLRRAPTRRRSSSSSTFVVEPGETVAIVGRSGSGKTTLIKLLAGPLRADRGDDLLRRLRHAHARLPDAAPPDRLRAAGELPLQRLDRRQHRVRRRDGSTRRSSSAAPKAANAHEFVQRLPLGYDTRVGESGLRLSGGQQQRVAIARALYHAPPILLFDEATSALDAESERAVKQSLDELLVGRTSFVIAHRLSTIRDADRILVLERGRLVEQGTHDELIARQGLYFYLSSQQLEL